MRLLATLLLLAAPAAAAVVTGTVRDPEGSPVAGAVVRSDTGSATKSGPDGAWRLDIDSTGTHYFTAESEGFVPVRQPVTIPSDLSLDLRFTKFTPSTQSVTVTADVRDEGILNPDPGRRILIRDEMLDANPGRPGVPVSVPGLPMETASGGIKAPQYFAPGVAGDHGEPVAQFFQVGSYFVPNNLSANAHGNGYADPNPIIPLVIESVEVDGGAFNVREGNHAVNLAVTYGLRSRLEPVLALTTDPHDIDIAAAWSPGAPATRAWIAVEAAWGNGLLATPERRRQYKVNASRVFDFGSHQLTLFGVAYYGQSRIPGLVPIDAAGARDTIDPRQHDQTHTGEIAANDIWRTSSSSELHLSGFFRTYNLALYSDFGDGLIRQSEFRTALGGQASYLKKLTEETSILAGVDFSGDAPHRLNLDRYASTDPSVYGPFSKVTSNNVGIQLLSPFFSLHHRLTSWLVFDAGWRRDQIRFQNTDLLAPANSFSRIAGVNSPKATLNVTAPSSLPLPSLAFSFGEAFFTNDPRTGAGANFGTPVSRARSLQMVLMRSVAGTDLRVTIGRLSQDQTLAKIDADTGLQFNQGPSRNQYITLAARRRFGRGMLEASVSKADARDLSDGAPIPEAPRMIFDVVGVIDRLPLRLRVRGEFEEVGARPLGDGYVGVPVKEFRGAISRAFCQGRLDVGINLQVARGFTGQTTEVVGIPGDDPLERVVGVRLPSYAGASLKWRF